MKSTRLRSSLNTQGNDYFNRQRFPVCRQAGMWPIKNKILTHEIEHDEYVTQWDDYEACEIPCLPTGRHLIVEKKL